MITHGQCESPSPHLLTNSRITTFFLPTSTVVSKLETSTSWIEIDSRTGTAHNFVVCTTKDDRSISKLGNLFWTRQVLQSRAIFAFFRPISHCKPIAYQTYRDVLANFNLSKTWKQMRHICQAQYGQIGSKISEMGRLYGEEILEPKKIRSPSWALGKNEQLGQGAARSNTKAKRV